MIYKNIFCTVGTTRFDSLCNTLLSDPILRILKSYGCQNLSIQIGNSILEQPVNDLGIKIVIFKFKDSILDDIRKADLVISHAGAGSCLEVLEAYKPLLVVVNEDLMDNHQLELAEQLQIDGHLYYCTCDTIESTLTEVDFKMLKPLPESNPSLFVKYLDDMLILKNK